MMASLICRLVAVGVGAVGLAASSSPAQVAGGGLDAAPGFEGMRERWAAAMAEFEVPGMAVAIVKDGKVLALEGFGVCAPPEGDSAAAERVAPTPDTMFYIASITKTYTATAICVLADEGKLSLDDPVSKYLPRFKLADDAPAGVPGTGDGGASKITIRDLLCHRPGLNGGPIVELDAFTGEITEDRYYYWLAKLKRREQPGYSNIHYTLLGRVIEAVTGKSWRDYLEERIFKPAGMTRTTGYASRMYGAPSPACALPMEVVRDDAGARPGTFRLCPLRKTDRTMHAAGGLGTSARDASRWLLLHVNDGQIDGKQIISAGLARGMRTLQAPFPQKQGSIRVMEGFGLAWQVGTFHGTALCSHGGGYDGAQTYYAILPEKKCGFAVLMNSGGAAAGLQDVIAVDILDRLIDGDERIDVLDAYCKRLAENATRTGERLKQRQADLAKPFELSRPAAEYAGTYECPELGTITVARDGERLKVAWGECALQVAAAGPEAFKVLGPTADGAVFRFTVDGAAVKDVSLIVPSEPPMAFGRR